MSCLFNSLSRFIDDERITGDTLRAIICKYLETDPVLVIDLKTVIFVETGLDVETYIRLMRNPSTFGGAIEIRAFTQIFKLNVCVKSLPNGKRIEFVDDPAYKWCVLTWSGNHYEAVDN